jgi:hypothetical protein
MNRFIILMAAFAFAMLMTASVMSEEVQLKQTGTLLTEPINARLETWHKYQLVMSNYEYVLDETDDWRLIDGSKPFSGDCEDFAFAMQAIVGAGSVYPAMSHAGANPSYLPDHAVFVYAGMVWELNGTVLDIARYQAQYAQILWEMGDITPELR